MKLLSIIIPAYNVSDYIEECVESLVKEKSIVDNLDVIIINDGSTDDTLKKAKKYEEMYPNSVRIIDKENGGHGSGINIGIKLAKGKYLRVLDSDDWIINDSLCKQIQYIRNTEYEPDIIINPYEQIWKQTDTIVMHKMDCFNNEQQLTLEDLNENGVRYTIHSMTIKTSLYKKNDIPEIDEKTSYDDVQYVLYPTPYINKIVYLDSVLYQYRMGNIGQSVDIRNMQRNRNKLCKIIENTYLYFKSKENIFSEGQREYFQRDLGETISDYFNVLFSMDDYKLAKQEFMQFSKNVDYSSKYINNKKAKFNIKTHFVFWGISSCYYRRKINNK